MPKVEWIERGIGLTLGFEYSSVKAEVVLSGTFNPDEETSVEAGQKLAEMALVAMEADIGHARRTNKVMAAIIEGASRKAIRTLERGGGGEPPPRAQHGRPTDPGAPPPPRDEPPPPPPRDGPPPPPPPTNPADGPPPTRAASRPAPPPGGEFDGFTAPPSTTYDPSKTRRKAPPGSAYVPGRETTMVPEGDT